MATYYSANCVYIVFISESIHDVANYTFGVDWNIRAYIAMMMIPAIIMGQVRFKAANNMILLLINEYHNKIHRSEY